MPDHAPHVSHPGAPQRWISAAGLVASLALLLGVLTACGDDDDDESSSVAASDQPADEDEGPASGDDALDGRTKPEVDLPEDPPSDELVMTDDVVGDGQEVRLNDTITVHYVGVTDDGEEFDSSWDRDAPATFELAEGALIEGWVKGIPGMRVGGRRTLVIPGSMAYGDEDRGDGRPFGTLVFVVDVLAVE